MRDRSLPEGVEEPHVMALSCPGECVGESATKDATAAGPLDLLVWPRGRGLALGGAVSLCAALGRGVSGGAAPVPDSSFSLIRVKGPRALGNQRLHFGMQAVLG